MYALLSAAARAPASAMSQSKVTASALEANLARFQLAVSYKHMIQNAKNPHSAPYRKAKSQLALNDPIRHFKTFVLGKKPKNPYVYIKYDESLCEPVKDNLNELEHNYFLHCFACSAYANPDNESEGKAMREYLNKDKLGLKEIPVNDTKCWKMKAVASTDPRLAKSAAAASSKKTSKKGRKKGEKDAKAVFAIACCAVCLPKPSVAPSSVAK